MLASRAGFRAANPQLGFAGRSAGHPYRVQFRVAETRAERIPVRGTESAACAALAAVLRRRKKRDAPVL
ncbi:hypothetical protein GCM10027360_03680 [Amycolatopsis echigonensis]